MVWTRTSQFAENKTLDGSVNRDYFGDDKNVWELHYDLINNDDYSTILSIYDDYINVGTRYFETTGEAITIGTLVHVQVNQRSFNVGGSQYLAGFVLTLIEA